MSLIKKFDLITGGFGYVRLLGDREEVDKLAAPEIGSRHRCTPFTARVRLPVSLCHIANSKMLGNSTQVITNYGD